MKGSVWLHLGRSTRGNSPACTHYDNSFLGLDMDALVKRKIMSVYLQKYDALLLSFSKLSSSIYSGCE